MAKNLFIKHGNPKHEVFLSEQEQIRGYARCERIFLIVEHDKPDYDYEGPNEVNWKFASQEGRKAMADGGMVMRSNDIKAVTNPACLIAAGHKEMVIDLDTSATVEKKSTKADK